MISISHPTWTYFRGTVTAARDIGHELLLVGLPRGHYDHFEVRIYYPRTNGELP